MSVFAPFAARPVMASYFCFFAVNQQLHAVTMDTSSIDIYYVPADKASIDLRAPSSVGQPVPAARLATA